MKSLNRDPFEKNHKTSLQEVVFGGFASYSKLQFVTHLSHQMLHLMYKNLLNRSEVDLQAKKIELMQKAKLPL